MYSEADDDRNYTRLAKYYNFGDLKGDADTIIDTHDVQK